MPEGHVAGMGGIPRCRAFGLAKFDFVGVAKGRLWANDVRIDTR